MSKHKKPDRLALEADAALSEGMSYGKWKARQFEQNGRKPVYYPEDWEDSDCGDTVCQDCGKTFNRTRKFVNFCHECRSRRASEGAKRYYEKRRAAEC